MPSFLSERDHQESPDFTLNSDLTDHDASLRKVRTKKKKPGTISANISGTKYEIVRVVIEEMAYVKIRDEEESANLIWSDSAVQHEKIAELRNYQRINHFPGMGEICRKDCLARNMTKMMKSQPQEYGFIPRTWIFPAEYTQFQNYAKELKRKRRQKTFIVKPANGAMGHGISLIRNGEKLHAQDHLIVQEYIDKPFLLEGYKFDLRVYILVTSCDPLRIFLYNDGLVRMGTEKYHSPNDSNLSQLYMHLTNYSVNKHNENFERVETEDKGSKRSIRWFTEFLRMNDHDVSKFWTDISELVVKTMIVAEPHVLHAYRMCRPGQPVGSESVCFEVLGFDIILDKKLKPWLLEINRAPSFGTDQKLDYDVKKGVLLNALQLLNIRASDRKKNLAKQKAEAQKRLYGHGSMKRLSPCSTDWEKKRLILERRKEELKERLVQVRKQISRDEYEVFHMGNYRRIYPPDDKQLLEKYESLLMAAFQTFLSGRAVSLQRELNNPLKRMKEEDILDLLEQCELDDEKLMGKPTRQREAKTLTSMPESTLTFKKHDYSSNSSCNSSIDGSESEEEYELDDHNEKQEKKVSYDVEEPKYKSMERSSFSSPISDDPNLKPSSVDLSICVGRCRATSSTGRLNLNPLKTAKTPSYSSTSLSTNPIRRSMSCPRSISVMTVQFPGSEQRSASVKPQISRPSTGIRSHSLNRNSSVNRAPPATTLGTITSSVSESLLHQRTKEQEEVLTMQTLFVLKDLRVKSPGKSDKETDLIIEDIMDNWKYHKSKVASYWLIKLDSIKQRKVLDIVRASTRSVLQRVWKVSDVECLHLYRSFNRVFNRLLWSHGQGLWNCFCNTGSSWETMFSKSTEVVTPQELQCCQRLVQLCKDCVLVVYKCATDSRESTIGVNHEWEDTRNFLPTTSQFITKTSSSNFSHSSSGTSRSNVLFASRFGPF
ncbi:tubulin polyglutamylase TTLL7 isoform X2 [Rhinatrema bivittatum]|uniref:tubulin polyglutamylase TTLL7 isoform X2 n=1 Tax=Rhinatrema bivittatum TaxID=194408 RepID=UPI00112D59A9|nr:tubulin polyglutamylase TTLL7 isoform X2 [Rhinatrema bivittatum]